MATWTWPSGCPTRRSAGQANAGSVQVLYGGPVGLNTSGSQVWNENSPGLGSLAENGDVFGFALVAGDFNLDGFCDLAIGIPGKNVGTGAHGGAVQILYGSTTGLAAAGSQIWHQHVAGIEGAAEADDYFGYSLAAGDFNGDGYVDLAVGVPYEDVGAAVDAGAVNILFGSATGLTATGNQLWIQDDIGFPGEASDFFGWALTVGDFNGDGKMDLAIGANGKDFAGSDRGVVNVIYGSDVGVFPLEYWHQGSTGIVGIPHDSDNFGKALAAGDFNKDGYADLAIGVPGDRDKRCREFRRRQCNLWFRQRVDDTKQSNLASESAKRLNSRVERIFRNGFGCRGF